jgi:exopolyphosphatase / guanosine-5'-triphosphate,3'-diphosphate pyrophosphatase
MPSAAIDIGSNSVLLLVMEGAQVLHDEARVVGLGKGLGERGVFRKDRMEATMEALAAYAETARGLGVEPGAVKAVATSASRRALNATTFYADVKKRTGLAVRVIGGEDEARLTWLGGISGIDVPSGPVMLVDPGGGSTEVILGEGGHIRSKISLEIGTVRLTEKFLGYGSVDPAALSHLRAEVDTAVSRVRLDPMPRAAVAVAGTVTTLAAMELGLTTYDGGLVHGSVLSAGALRKWVDALMAATPEERKRIVAVSPERADTLLAGAVILLRLLELAKRQSFKVSDRGLRYGVLSG